MAGNVVMFLAFVMREIVLRFFRDGTDASDQFAFFRM